MRAGRSAWRRACCPAERPRRYPPRRALLLIQRRSWNGGQAIGFLAGELTDESGAIVATATATAQIRPATNP